MYRILASLIVIVTACSTPDTSSPPPTAERSSGILGLLEVTITGLGEGTTPTATAAFVRADSAHLGPQSATVVPVNGANAPGDVFISPGTVGVFDDRSTPASRYVQTSFNLTNRTTLTFSNLTFYAVNVPTNIGGTAITSMTTATGTAITDESFARASQPVHAVRPNGRSLEVNPAIADLQVFTSQEAKSVQTQGANLGVLPGGSTVLGYGYVARNLGGGRPIAAASSGTNCKVSPNPCQGTITLAYKFPRGINSPVTFRLSFLVANETRSSVSQSPEEQKANTVAGLSLSAIPAGTQVRVLSGSSVTGLNKLDLCRVPFAVATVANPSVLRFPTPASGSLDTCFGTDGKVTTAIGSSQDRGNAVALQSDGKIVVAGSSFNGSNDDFALVRYTSSGSLDGTFGSGGKVTTTFGSIEGGANAVALQSDGKIVAAGRSRTSTGSVIALVRYNSDGSLDTGFGVGGKVTTSVGSSDDGANAVALQSDGKIVVAGTSLMTGSSYDFAVLRYNPNGSLDTSFDGDGKVTTSLSVSDDYALSVAIQPDGKVVVAGNSYGTNERGFTLVRYQANGSLDTTFDGDGKVTITVGGYKDTPSAVLIQSDGKIVTAGYSFSDGHANFTLIRFNTNGSLDASFDADGIVTTSVSPSDDAAQAAAIQSDGKIVAAGFSNGGNNDFALVRYNTDGSLDSLFGGGGIVTTPIGPSYDIANAITIQPDGKIVVAGYSFNGSNTDFALIRFNP